MRDFSKLTTRHLLRLREYSYRGSWISNDGLLDENGKPFTKEDLEALYAELSKREHIPNKVESAANRRAASTQHRKSKKKLQYKR